MTTQFLASHFLARVVHSLAFAVTISGTSAFGIPKGKASDATTDAETARLDLKSDRVVVFKDGYCLVVKQATATTDTNGNVFTDEVPDAAVLGSFWVVPEKGTIKSTIAGWIESETKTSQELTCTNIVEIVKSNLGKECALVVGEQRLEGTLLKILSNDDRPEESLLSGHDTNSQLIYSPGHAPSTAPAAKTAVAKMTSSVTGSYFLVRTREGDKMILANAVSDLTIDDMKTSIDQTVTTKSRHKRLTMNFGEVNSEIKLHLMYFRPDVRWIPTYRLNLTGLAIADKPDRKKGELILQGEIINEAEDFTTVPFHVVVGVPNFRFRSVVSPMVLEAALRNSLAQAAPNVMGMGLKNMSNALYSQRVAESPSNHTEGAESRSTVELPDELVGKGGNDLFVYELPAMTLKRSERAILPILQTEFEYRDVYTWDIELKHSESFAATSADSPSPLVLSEAKVWRQVELINNTDIPWTTGAAMLVDGKQPLAQELLTYTSPGGICRVPVTVSVDLQGKVEDAETNRVYNAIKWRGNDYLRIEGNIEAKLANNKAESVPVEVRLRFGGKAKKASHEGNVTLQAFRQEDWHEHRGDPINNSSVVRWTATIAPGECLKPSVNYEFFINH